MSAGRRSMLFMVLFVTLWTVVEALAGALSGPYSLYQVVWTRYAVHLALMLAVWGWREPMSLVRTRRPAFQLARSMLMLVMPASWIMAVQRGVDPGVVAALFGLAPLLVLLFARAFNAESAAGPLWLASGAAFMGAFLLADPGPAPPLPLLALAAAPAVSLSLYVVMTRSLRGETMCANLFYSALGVFLALSVVMPRAWTTPTVRDLLILVAVGVLGWVVLFALDRMAEAAPVSVAAPLMNLHLVFSLGLALGVGHQDPTPGVVAGALIIGATALYAWWREPRPLLRPGVA